MTVNAVRRCEVSEDIEKICDALVEASATEIKTDSRLVQCTRCRNKHPYSSRIDKPDKKFKYLSHSSCPRCGGTNYYQLNT